MKYKILRFLFRVTPAQWISDGCNTNIKSLQNWWGLKITEWYGSAKEPEVNLFSRKVK